jgi:hypothetical protein
MSWPPTPSASLPQLPPTASPIVDQLSVFQPLEPRVPRFEKRSATYSVLSGAKRSLKQFVLHGTHLCKRPRADPSVPKHLTNNELATPNETTYSLVEWATGNGCSRCGNSLPTPWAKDEQRNLSHIRDPRSGPTVVLPVVGSSVPLPPVNRLYKVLLGATLYSPFVRRPPLKW